MKYLFPTFFLTLFIVNVSAQQNEIIHLWPNDVPGETEAKHPPVKSDNTSGNVLRISDITDPAIVLFPALKSNNNGVGIVVCPGGGYSKLAVDKEGYEIAEWLNTLGYSAYVLQYRVPKKQEGALQDVQRAIRIVRGNSEKWNLYSDKFGVMGFSAGGSLSARASTMYQENTYPRVDKIDELSCRPDFAMLIYPAYLDQGENRSLTPELKVNERTPSTFIFQTADDGLANSALIYAQALRDVKVSIELHLLPNGGHGYGMRPGNIAAETWPVLAEKWLSTQF